MAIRRGRLEIKIDILKCCSNPIILTNLMSKVNINEELWYELMPELVNPGLIRIERNKLHQSRSGQKRKYTVYSLTDKGISFLDKYKEILVMLGDSKW